MNDWDDNEDSQASVLLYTAPVQYHSGSVNPDSNPNFQEQITKQFSRRGRGNFNRNSTSDNYNRGGDFKNGRNFNRDDNARGGFSRGGNFIRGGNRGREYGNNWRDRQNNTVSKETLKEIFVPSKLVGKIIGRGGATISNLQSKSNAKINIVKNNKSENTLIKITGNKEGIQIAESLINKIVEGEPPPQVKPAFNPLQAEPAVTPSQENFQQQVEMNNDIIDWAELSRQCDARRAEELAKLPLIIKNFYQEDPEVASMTKEEVESYRLCKNNINVDRMFTESEIKPIPNPVKTFEQAFRNYPEILREIEKANFTEPSPIQSQAWPVLLSGEDMIGIAQTGTGKTLAFILPALIHIEGQITPRKERTGPTVLILAPTRELAAQIEREINKYQYRGIKAVCVYGGVSKKDQVTAIERGVDIVIATPGRMNDLYSARKLDIQFVTYVVLDEADRMLDMGFEPQIRKVMYDIRPDRQTIMTSATWPSGVRALAKSYMNNPVQVVVGTLSLAAVHSVTQNIVLLPDDENAKFETFIEFVQNLNEDEKVICFCGKKSKASFLASELAMKYIDCTSIHGDLDQCEREQSLVDIKDGSVKILIATDVASRGIDIEDITHVVNYDFPKNIEEYVHRVGRTGRAGRIGTSISYFTRADWAQAKELIEILKEADQYIPEELYKMSDRFEARMQRNQDRPRRKNRYGGSDFGIRY